MYKIKELFQVYKEAEDYMDEFKNLIYEVAVKNKDEFQSLIKLFKDEDDCFYKLDLAEILIRLEYYDIPDYIEKCLKSNNVLDQYRAAILYIKCENPLGIKVLKHYVNHPRAILPDWILTDLKETNNEMGKKLYEDLYPICMVLSKEVGNFSRGKEHYLKFCTKEHAYKFKNSK